MSSAASSESDDSRRPSPPKPPGIYPDARKPKKKKKHVPPQESINKIWSKFSVPKFSKATVILPFAATPAARNGQPSGSDPLAACSATQNLLVSEDFERAVQECRARVKKLISECKRVNMRYRDPDFDVDWDLKWEKGHCLNGLGEPRFEMGGRAFHNPSSIVPKTVKRVHEIFDKPTFLEGKISPADVKQGLLGDCWLMASLTALANMEVGIQRICVEYDTKVGIYGFVFHRDGEWIISIIDDKLYLKSPDWDSPSVQRHLLEQIDREDVEKEYRKTYQSGSQSLFFAHCRDQNETWLPLLEKAYAKAHGDYAALQGGWIGEGVEDLTGGVTTELLTSDILDIDDFWNNEILKVNKEFLFGCSTGLLDGGYGNREGISEGHAYVIMEARELSNGTRLLKLRNPWGKGKKGNWEGAWSDGSKEFTPEAQQELNHKFGNDSVFWISYNDLLRKYQHFDRTRLFMDSPDWRLTQSWVSVEVPWKAEFEQKFKIVLKKESPVVLMLSQLDDRYFEGLKGQYSFRLQFRLHEIDSPGEHDYIVRSHGNYLMSRSVVTELKTLRAGTYSVFIMVMAERDLSTPSVEEVVKMHCRSKADNDKLAQVGMSYDFAHRKGAAHMAVVKRARKSNDKANARQARIVLRKKNWEARHMSRNIMRKQEKKNREKRGRKDARDEEEQKEKDEKEHSEAMDRERKLPQDKAVQTEGAREVQFATENKSVQTEDAPVIVEISIDESRRESKNAPGTASPESQGTPETPKSIPDIGSPGNVFPLRSRRVPSPPRHCYPLRRRPSAASRVEYSRGPPPPQRSYGSSEGESSASPISDFDNMYSDDDPTLKPRPVRNNSHPGPGPIKPRTYDSDDEDEPEPWNAICIVGFRVYSKDDGLELKVVVDGVDDDQCQGPEEDDRGTDADVEDHDTKDEPSENQKKDPAQTTTDEALQTAEGATQGVKMDALEQV
ncbi:Calpain-9 [Phlyctema vagabunda]|uniref:Calpain-9 n=1 Tax=Phlyctema vagabunda TaxID=108571 RepID=A0ABR4P212_9HELO